LVEKFIAAQIERGTRQAILLTFETLILSVVCYFVVQSLWLGNLVLTFPIPIIIICLIINFLLGKWTGLRLTEYLRFREAIKHVELPKKK